MEIYLDNAATSHPKPSEVLRAVQAALTDFNGNPGRSGHRRALQGARTLWETRRALSGLINASQPENIAFCFNCTDALNTAIKGSLHVGDHVIASVLEHNSVLRVLEELRRGDMISYTLIPPESNGMVDPEKFRSAIRSDTRLCILTHASNVTGIIQPVAAVGKVMRQYGIRYLIDGAQAIGHIGVDVQALGCDLYAFPGHKGLLAPQGTGGLYIASDLPLRTFREGGTGSDSQLISQPTDRPECYESGTLNLPGISGLLAGVRLISENHFRFIQQERQLTAALLDGLQNIPEVTLYTPNDPSGCVGTVSFNVGTQFTSSEAADYLNSCGIAVRGGLHCAPYAHRHLGTLDRGAVRASLNWQNTLEDIEALLSAVRKMR